MTLPAVLVLVAAGVTLLEFPVGFGHVVASDAWGVTLLLLRNGLLVATSLIAARRLWRSTVPGARGGAPTGERALLAGAGQPSRVAR